MARTSNRSWVRPYDWAAVVLGVVAILSPLWVSTSNMAMWSLIVLGALIVISGLVSLAMPDMLYGQGVQMVLGALLFISPWAMSYSQYSGASWTSWVVGALSVVVGAAALQMASAASRTAAGQH